ncbi:MAG: Ig domain-containing protein [Synergistaceae bacterium]|nr:Ig domain-containing protein [Synergistaceae bacterium]
MIQGDADLTVDVLDANAITIQGDATFTVDVLDANAITIQGDATFTVDALTTKKDHKLVFGEYSSPDITINNYAFDLTGAAAGNILLDVISIDVSRVTGLNVERDQVTLTGAPSGLALGDTIILIDEGLVGSDWSESVSCGGYSFSLEKSESQLLAEISDIEPPAITTTSLPNGTVGTLYNQTLAATGATPITWSVSVGSLPAGLSLSGGVISGTPTTSGALNFTVTAQNGGGSATQALSITINAADDGVNPPNTEPDRATRNPFGCDDTGGCNTGVGGELLLALAALALKRTRRPGGY